MIDIDQEYKDRFLQYGGKTMRIIILREGVDILYPSETLYPAESLYPSEISKENISYELTDENIHTDSLTITDSLSSGEDLEFGSCEAAQMEVTVTGLDRDVTGAECFVTLGFDNWELLLGVFEIESTPKENDRNTRKIIAYDRMILFDKDVSGWYNTLKFPMTLKDFRESLCDFVGVHTAPQSSYNLVNDSMTVEKTLDTMILNGRDVLRWICQINGVFGHVNSAGYLEFISIAKTADVADTITSYREVTSEEYSVPDIDTVHIRMEEGDIGGISAGDGQNVYIIEDNPLVYGKTTSQMAAIANNIRTKVAGLSYTPATANNSAMPWYEMGDRVVLATSDGNVNTLIMKRTLTGIQGMMESWESTGTTERGQTFSIQTEIMRAKGLSAILKRTVEEISNEMHDFEAQTTSKFTQTAAQIQAEVTRASKEEGKLSSRITQTANSITSEVTRAKAAEATLTSRITQTADSITAEVSRAKAEEATLRTSIKQTSDSITLEASRAKKEENTLRSQIQVNAEAIKLKVSNGQVSSQLSVESGGVNIRGNRFSWTSTNSNMTADGTLTCNNIKATNGTFTGTINGSTISGGEIKGTNLSGVGISAVSIYSAGNFELASAGTFDDELDRFSIDSEGATVGHSFMFPRYMADTMYNRQDAGFFGEMIYGTLAGGSDRTLKKDIVPLETDMIVGLIKGLKPVRFKWKKNDTDGFGFVAQDVQQTAAEIGLDLPLVTEHPLKKTLAIPYENYTALLTVAVQDLYRRVEKLEVKA